LKRPGAAWHWLAAAESDEYTSWVSKFREAMRGFKLIPASRIIAGIGTERNIAMLICFVMGTIGDDLGSTFDNLHKAALIMQRGGGIGYDFSTLHPKDAPVRRVGANASGPLSFMDV
jgi:ribonucleoside-diphosphate reductase alpha chain